MTEKEKIGRERLERMLAKYENIAHGGEKGERIPHKKERATLGHRIAAIAASILLSLGISSTVYAVKEPISRYFESLFSCNSQPNSVWSPGEAPSGFFLSAWESKNGCLTVRFCDAYKNEIVFRQVSAEPTETIPSGFDVLPNTPQLAVSEEVGHRTYIRYMEHTLLQYTFPRYLTEKECLAMITTTELHITGEDCVAWESRADHCTEGTYCILCSRILNASSHRYHDAGSALNIGDALYHKVICKHKTVSGIPCEVNLLETHHFQNEKCTECGYDGGKK